MGESLGFRLPVSSFFRVFVVVSALAVANGVDAHAAADSELVFGVANSTGIDTKLVSFAHGMFKRFDSNGDGRLDTEEWAKMPGDPKSADLNGDGAIELTELAQRLAANSRNRAGGWGTHRSQWSGVRWSSPRPEGKSEGRRHSYRFRSPLERLPEGLPNWFTLHDFDGDGQVMMFEYSTIWTEEKAAEFIRYDENGDGVITFKECLATQSQEKAAEQKAAEPIEANR
jgi:Ca2+-binding EF-hand superfamily protein